MNYRLPALAITDHGNMYGAIKFYDACRKAGIKPIIGCEVYVAPGSRFEKSSHGIRSASYHMTLLARNEEGYLNLIKLVTAGHLEGFYYKPRVDKEILSEYSKGLVALSGCLKSELAHLCLSEEKDEALKVIGEYKDIFEPGCYYLELQDHLIPEQVEYNKFLIHACKSMNLPPVVTNDVHYIKRADSEAHQVLLCIQTQTNLEDPKRMRLSTDEFYFKSPEEMKSLFSEVPEAAANTIEIAQKCNLEMEFGVFKMPHYTPPQGTTNEDFLRKLCDQGLKKRYGKPSEEQLKRVDFELSVIKQMGFISYFLIVWDVIRFAKENNIPMGPGRGSATGSLVSYALEIVNIDPLKYDLMFERFLNPDRVNMPDIDIDFCYERRDEVINYVRRKYGQDNVAQIITFGTMAAKGVIRDVGRARGMLYNDVDRIAKLIPNELNITLADAIKKEPELKHLYENDEQITSLITTSLALEGLNRHASTHAAGVVISEDNLTNHTPLCKTSDGQISTQYAMGSLEMVGLLKMDFLGLKTLTVINQTIEKISRTKKEKIDIDKISLDDKKTFDLLGEGRTIGIFQLESSGMRDLLKKMKSRKFEDIIALNALYRPGPMASIDDYIKCKHNTKLIKYDHPQEESILKNTYGVIVYQEQCMMIVTKLANMSLSQADILYRAMKKKTPEVMEKQKKIFIEGAHKNGIRKSVAEKIFSSIETFAGYGFNKSHSTAYAMIAYQTAYLKANYPAEFMSSLLTSEKDRIDKIVLYIEEARNMNIPVLPPDVNESYSEFTVVGDSIRFGLSAVKNVGLGAIASIVETRKSQSAFKSLYDFCEHVDLRTVNRKVLESLIKCGAFDNLKAKRSQMIAVLDRAVEMGQSLQKDKQSGQMSFFDDFEKQDKFRQEVHEFPDMKEWPENQLLAFEKELLGFYVTGHPLTKYEKILNTYMTCPATGMVEIEDGSEVMTGGIINKLRTTFTKRGEKMAFFTLEDLSGVIEVAALPDTYRDAASIIALDSMILVRGRLERREEEPKIRAREIIPLDQARAKYTAAIEIVISTSGLEEDMLKSLNRIFQSNQGSVPAYLRFRTSKNKTYRMLVDSIKGINPTDKFSTDIEKLLGKDSLKFFKNNKK